MKKTTALLAALLLTSAGVTAVKAGDHQSRNPSIRCGKPHDIYRQRAT